MLRKFDAELLIGQISYKQKADIYNVTKGYDNTKNVCSFESSDKGDHKSIHGYVHQENIICSVKLSIYFSLGFNKDNQWTDVGLSQLI